MTWRCRKSFFVDTGCCDYLCQPNEYKSPAKRPAWWHKPATRFNKNNTMHDRRSPSTLADLGPKAHVIANGAVFLRNFVRDPDALFDEIEQVTVLAPLRQMIVPGGHKMSVAMTNCGTVGWTTDQYGYRYTNLIHFLQPLGRKCPIAFVSLHKVPLQKRAFLASIPMLALLIDTNLARRWVCTRTRMKAT